MKIADVTVLIPCSDSRYLADCLKSIRNQSILPSCVLIVLNGDALRLSSSEVEEYKSILPCKSVFYFLEEKGIVSALNFGLSKISTTFVARLDADDVMPVDRIENQIEFLYSNVDVVAVGGQVLDFQTGELRIPYPQNHVEIFDSLFRFCSLPHPGTTMRMQSMKEVKFYSHEFEYVEDWDLWIRLSRIGKLANLGSNVLQYRLHPGQISNSASAKSYRGQTKMTRRRFQDSLTNFGKQCGCEACMQRRKRSEPKKRKMSIFGRSGMFLIHSLVYSLSCLSGHFYVLGKKHSASRPLVSFLFLALCALVKPRWAINAARKLKTSHSTN